MDIDLDNRHQSMHPKYLWSLWWSRWWWLCNKCLCWPTLCNCASITSQAPPSAVASAACGGGWRRCGSTRTHHRRPASLFVVYCWTAQWSGDSWAADWSRWQRNFAVIFSIFGEDALQVPSPCWKHLLALSLVRIYYDTVIHRRLKSLHMKLGQLSIIIKDLNWWAFFQGSWLSGYWPFNENLYRQASQCIQW